MLLLFAVRMVRTGIERLFGATFRRYMLESESLPQSLDLQPRVVLERKHMTRARSLRVASLVLA